MKEFVTSRTDRITKNIGFLQVKELVVTRNTEQLFGHCSTVLSGIFSWIASDDLLLPRTPSSAGMSRGRCSCGDLGLHTSYGSLPGGPVSDLHCIFICTFELISFPSLFSLQTLPCTPLCSLSNSCTLSFNCCRTYMFLNINATFPVHLMLFIGICF